MMGRKKSKQACTKGLLSQRSQEDRLSQLPEPLICQILSHLPTKDMVKTSVLSTTWKSLWLSVPRLDLDSRDFPNFNAFVSFGDKFFDSDRVLSINMLKLSINGTRRNRYGVGRHGSYPKSWIRAAIKRKIQHLDVCFLPQFHKTHLNLYKCETLVNLKLVEVTLGKAKILSFPFMKTMHLEDIVYPSEATFKKLISSCPVLEDLTVIVYGKDNKSFPVHSRSLQRLNFVRITSLPCVAVSGVVINAPLLCSLRIEDNVSKSFIVNNLGSSAKLDLSILFGSWDYDEVISLTSSRSSIGRFLPGISKVKELVVRPRTFKLLCQYAKLVPLPQFHDMSRLCVTLSLNDLNLLPTFLESCPNLKSLILDSNSNYEKMFLEGNDLISMTSVPECVLSSLEFVDIKNSNFVYAAGMKLVKYFLENSTILKKLDLCLKYCSPKDDIFKRLCKIPKRSVTCQVGIVFA